MFIEYLLCASTSLDPKDIALNKNKERLFFPGT